MELMFKLNLQMFADAGTAVNITTNGTTGVVNAYTGAYDASATTTQSMSATMKTYYDTELLENAREKLIFTQLGKKQNLPANHGETVEWRKWNTFAKALTPLVEGVIPTGQKFGITSTNVTVKQYGDYAAISDRLDLHAVDNVILGATEEMGAAGGETADTLVRNELTTGTFVLYADTTSVGAVTGTPTGRWGLAANNNKLTPDTVNKAYTWLKKNKAPYYSGNKYVAVIHPSVAYDLRSSKDWIEAHKYDATTEIFNGEIGELHGVRFIESTEAPIFNGGNLFASGNQSYLTITAYSGTDSTSSAGAGVTSAYKFTVDETLTEADGKALIGRKIHFYDTSATALIGTLTIVGCTYGSKYIWTDRATPAAIGSSPNYDKFYPGEGGNSTSAPCAVYATLFFGKDAFSVVDPEGMGMQMIIKDRGEVGGPLEQFSTVGYKFENATKILYQERMIRVESCSAYSTTDDAN